ASFGNSVREEHKAVAAAQLHIVLVVLRSSSGAEHSIVSAEAFNGAVSMSQHRPVMAGVGESQTARPRIEHAVKERDELARHIVGGDGLVHAVAKRGGMAQLRSEHAD